MGLPLTRSSECCGAPDGVATVDAMPIELHRYCYDGQPGSLVGVGRFNGIRERQREGVFLL
jgi:hypothetical protein